MKFSYQARDKQGQNHQGIIQASSKEVAFALVSKSGLYVTFLESEHEKPLYARNIAWFQRVSFKELVVFSRELAIMVKTHTSLVEALRVLSAQMQNAKFREILVEISEATESGIPLSAALARHPSVFSLFYVSMVRSGEASGKLTETLAYLADHLERDYAISRKIKTALLYPAFVLGVTVIILTLMTYVVIPNFIKTFSAGGQELPLITQFVIGVSFFIRRWGLVVLAACIAGVFGALRYIRTAEGRRVFDAVILKIPLLGSLLSMTYVTRFAENLSTLIAGGIPIVEALDIVKDIVGNAVYGDVIQAAKEEVGNGRKISAVLSRSPDKFPPVFIQMVLAGENSGVLDATLSEVARFYQQELSTAIDTFVAVLEPLFIVVLGVMVGGIMASLILPMYQMSGE